MMQIVVTLPWPPRELSPNARLHWSKLAKAKKSYRAACWAAVLEQKASAPKWPAIDLLMVFMPPDRRSYDRDNLSARMKSGLDGVCDAWGIDDKRFARVAVEVQTPVAKAKGAAHVLVVAREHVREWVIRRDEQGMPAGVAL